MSHDSTAAYAASQPLFDALRSAVDRTNEQHTHLCNARDQVQQTHVRLPGSLSNGDMSQNTRYIESAIKAWRSVTESYADIFNALAQASAAEPSEGRPMREGHESFVKMARMANEANSVAESFVLHELQQNGRPERAEQEESESASNASHESETRRVAPISSLPATKARSDSMRPNGKEAKRMRKVQESREEHKKKILALRANKKDTKGQATKADASSVPGAPNVEYEDVSAEVEARLKAKQAKKEAAKKEKKRKRDSAESLGADVAEEAVVEKPTKKRSRPNGVRDDVEMVAVKEKRKKDSGGGDDGVGWTRHKKAKTKG